MDRDDTISHFKRIRIYNGPSESPQVETPVIAELWGVSKYFGDLLAVGNVDLSISSGESLSFLGPSRAAVRQLCSVCLLALRHRRRHRAER